MFRLLFLSVAIVFASSVSAAGSKTRLPAQANVSSTKAKSVVAGNLSPSKLRLIAIGGVTMMGMDTTNGRRNLSPDTGIAAGLFGEFGSGSLTFQTGLLYNQAGARVLDSAITLDYLSVPVLAKYNVFNTPAQTLYVKGGLMLSFLASKRTTNIDRDVANELEETNLDVPVVVGFGGSFPLTETQSLQMEMTYVRSTGDSVRERFGSTILRNQGFAFMTGVSFAL